MENKTVSIVYGEKRKENIIKSLELLNDYLFEEKLKNKDTILIKPNFVSTTNQLAATHKDAVLGFLEFMKSRSYLENKKIIIAEGATLGKTEEGFQNFNYFDLTKNFPQIEFIDLNNTESSEVEIFNTNLNLIKIKASKLMIKDFNPNIFYVSICPLKTHDTVIVTLSIKNIIVGSLQNDKPKIHQGYKAINLTLAHLYKKYISPDLSIIDAYEGMEGNGPVNGTPVKMNLAIASFNPILADAVGAFLMNVEPSKVGYLYYLGVDEDYLQKATILGEDINKHRFNFKLHSTAPKQLLWQ